MISLKRISSLKLRNGLWYISSNKSHIKVFEVKIYISILKSPGVCPSVSTFWDRVLCPSPPPYICYLSYDIISYISDIILTVLVVRPPPLFKHLFKISDIKCPSPPCHYLSTHHLLLSLLNMFILFSSNPSKIIWSVPPTLIEGIVEFI